MRIVHGAIIEKYTYLRKVFNAINNEQMNYNWLITDYECYPTSIEISDLFSQEYCWLTGEQLTRIIGEEDFQWIWGVLSGFPKDIPLSEVLKYPLPYADGYKGFWKNPLTIQNPLASIEIVPWDSSCTLIFSENKSIIYNFIKGFPLAKSMISYNEEIRG